MTISHTTHFVSGHLTLTEAEFQHHYQPALDQALAHGDAFVVGDARGADAMTQTYLHGKTAAVTVYHMFTTPRHNPGFRTLGGFQTDQERDAQMTQDSDCDIAWVRPGRENSGTQRNLHQHLHLDPVERRLGQSFVELLQPSDRIEVVYRVIVGPLQWLD